MKILFHSKILQYFINEARQNYDSSGKIVETLCYFIGQVENNQENDEESKRVQVKILKNKKVTSH